MTHKPCDVNRNKEIIGVVYIVYMIGLAQKLVSLKTITKFKRVSVFFSCAPKSVEFDLKYFYKKSEKQID